MRRYILCNLHNMNIKKVLLSSIIALCLTSCAFIPAISDKQLYYHQCDMVTKKLTLEPTDIGTLDSCGNGDLQQCIISVGIVSYIVSGSLVLIGNTRHCSEYKLCLSLNISAYSYLLIKSY